ncbi:MAG: hypothetical protein K6T92_08625, partial [Candidatus Rokubacteria bacterium]|nr:hypothetical protein [Candidatus Rokubacteria bacterium]
MNNPWKLTTIGLALVLTTALLTGLATAYFTRPAATADVGSAVARPLDAPDPTATRAGRRPAVAAPAGVKRAVVSVPAPAPSAVATSETASVATALAPASAATAAGAPADCASGGERAWR